MAYIDIAISLLLNSIYYNESIAGIYGRLILKIQGYNTYNSSRTMIGPWALISLIMALLKFDNSNVTVNDIGSKAYIYKRVM